MTAQTPPAFEAAQQKIHKVHRILFYAIVAAFWGSIFLLDPLFAKSEHDAVTPKLGFMGLMILLGISVMASSVYFDRLSRKYGYVCPHCKAPLYDATGTALKTGQCLRCKKAIF